MIGSGTGRHAFAAGLNPGTEQVKVIEIVAPVIETLRTYTAAGGRSGVDELLSSKRFDVTVADGRHSLALDPVRYDVIEADAILPKTAASPALNSREFFEQVRAKLAAGDSTCNGRRPKLGRDIRSVFPT